MSPRLVWSQTLRRLIPEDEAALSVPLEGIPSGGAVGEPAVRVGPDPSVTRPAKNQTRARSPRARAAVDLSAVVAAAQAHAEAVRETARASRARSEAIAGALEGGASLAQVANALGISRVTVLKLARSVQPDPSANTLTSRPESA